MTGRKTVYVVVLVLIVVGLLWLLLRPAGGVRQPAATVGPEAAADAGRSSPEAPPPPAPAPATRVTAPRPVIRPPAPAAAPSPQPPRLPPLVPGQYDFGQE